MTKARDLANASTALSAVSATELGYLDGVTSAVQTQMDAKLASSTAATTYVANSLADAKGDIFVASADNTVTRLAVGNNGETLVADSSTSTGLRYQSAYNGNGTINGAMDCWQRGTSFTIASATSTYTADRWQAYRGATGSTVTRQSSGLTGIQYAMRVARDSGNTSTTAIQMAQAFESANSYIFAGQTVTLSFYARAGANYSPTSSALSVYLQTGTGSDQNYYSGLTGASNIVNGSTATLTTSWQRFSFTATAGSTATQIAIALVSFPTGTAGANDYYEVTGVQLELGSVATQFKRAGGTIQGELAACQRYYQRITNDAANLYGFLTNHGAARNTGALKVNYPYKVTMRVAPTTLDYSTLGITNDDGNVYSVSSATLDNTTTSAVASIAANTASTLTQYRPYFICANNSASAYIGFSAEL